MTNGRKPLDSTLTRNRNAAHKLAGQLTGLGFKVGVEMVPHYRVTVAAAAWKDAAAKLKELRAAAEAEWRERR